MEDSLCIITYHNIAIVDLKKIMESKNWDGGKGKGKGKVPLQPPPLKRMVNFKKENMPLGMGFLKLGSTLYMFGGEYLTKRSRITNGLACGLGLLSSVVMKLDLSDPNSKPVHVCDMKAPKLYPIVFEFDGKIYILSAKSMGTAFEVWDPISQEFRTLPNPPCFRQGAMRIFSHFFKERGIVVASEGMAGGGDWYFDIDSENWKAFTRISAPDSLRLRAEGKAASGHIKVFYTADHKRLYLNQLPSGPDNHCRIESHDLRKNYPKILSGHGYHFDDLPREKGSAVDLGKGYVCSLLSLWDSQMKWGLYFNILRVDQLLHPPPTKKRKRESRNSDRVKKFSFTSLKQQIYDFNLHVPKGDEPLSFIRQAFVLGKCRVFEEDEDVGRLRNRRRR